MKNEFDNLNDVFGEMMQFCGMCNGQIGNKTIQEFKKDKAIEKYTTYSDKSEQLPHHVGTQLARRRLAEAILESVMVLSYQFNG